MMAGHSELLGPGAKSRSALQNWLVDPCASCPPPVTVQCCSEFAPLLSRAAGVGQTLKNALSSVTVFRALPGILFLRARCCSAVPPNCCAAGVGHCAAMLGNIRSPLLPRWLGPPFSPSDALGL